MLQATDGATTEATKDHIIDENDEIWKISYLADIGCMLLKGGAGLRKVEQLLSIFAAGRFTYDTPIELGSAVKDALTKAEIRYFQTDSQNFQAEVEEWLATKSGSFSLQIGYSELHLTTKEKKKHFRTCIARAEEKGLCEKTGTRAGIYRKVEKNEEEEDWRKVSELGISLWLPFELDEMLVIPHGSVIIVAGASGAGKTAILMNVARENMAQFDTHYFSSEIGPGMFKKRASKFPDISPDMWNVHFYSRGSDFADVIRPGKDSLNIIDYLEIHDNFYQISKYIFDIHAKLFGATAIVALQKNPGLEVGLGGYRSIEKAELALAIDSGKVKITKVREWNPDFDNPNKKEYRFNLIDGCRFKKEQGWHYPIKEF